MRYRHHALWLVAIGTLAGLLATGLLAMCAQRRPAPPQQQQQTKRYIWYGLSLDAEKGRGLLIDGVTAGSPAQRAGFKIGSFITEVNGKDTTKHTNSNTAMSTFFASSKIGDTFRCRVADDRGRTKSLTLTSIEAPPNVVEQITFLNTVFQPAYKAYESARDAKNLAGIASAKKKLYELCARNAKNKRWIVAGFKAKDEFMHNWILCQGFMGSSERKKLEKEFGRAAKPKVRRGVKPPAYRIIKTNIAAALAVMASPDTNLDVIKTLLSDSSPVVVRYGAQLVGAIFQELSQKRGGDRKTTKLAKKMVAEQIVKLLGQPVIDQLDTIKRYEKVYNQWVGMGKPSLSRLSPKSAQAVYVSRFYIERCKEQAYALGWIPAFLSVSYLIRIREGVASAAQAAADGLKRVFPGHGDATWAWYGENRKYLYYDTDREVIAYSAEAKAAGQPYEQWIKDNK